jgi:hypothetical protein
LKKEHEQGFLNLLKKFKIDPLEAELLLRNSRGWLRNVFPGSQGPLIAALKGFWKLFGVL